MQHFLARIDQNSVTVSVGGAVVKCYRISPDVLISLPVSPELVIVTPVHSVPVEIEIDPVAKSALVDGKMLDLTKKEYFLLLYFVTNKNRVLTKEAIAEHLWGDSIDMVDNFDFIYTHMRNLRKKLKKQGAKDYLQTIYGLGYKFGE